LPELGSTPQLAKVFQVYSFLEETVAGNMTRAVKTVPPETTMRTLHQLFAADDFNGYPVVGDGKLLGVVSKFDFMNCFAFTPSHLIPRYNDLMNKTVAEVMTHEFVSVGPDTKLQRVLQLMVNHRIRSMPVVDNDGHLKGIIARDDVMRALDRCAAS
jgi:CBS domain-containing protein